MCSFLKHTLPIIFMGTAWVTASSTIHFWLLQCSHLEAQPIHPWLVGGAVHSGHRCVSRRGLCAPLLPIPWLVVWRLLLQFLWGSITNLMALKRKLITFSIEYKGTKNSLEMLTKFCTHGLGLGKMSIY